MSNFILSFRGQEDRTASAEELEAWGGWFQQLGATVVDSGHRVGRVQALGAVGKGTGTSREILTGYVVVDAADFDAAVEVAKGCPGLSHGGGVEVGEAIENM
jgi:hypothetical protein